jgi:hypothetical protein
LPFQGYSFKHRPTCDSAAEFRSVTQNGGFYGFPIHGNLEGYASVGGKSNAHHLTVESSSSTGLYDSVRIEDFKLLSGLQLAKSRSGHCGLLDRLDESRYVLSLHSIVSVASPLRISRLIRVPLSVAVWLNIREQP